MHAHPRTLEAHRTHPAKQPKENPIIHGDFIGTRCNKPMAPIIIAAGAIVIA